MTVTIQLAGRPLAQKGATEVSLTFTKNNLDRKIKKQSSPSSAPSTLNRSRRRPSSTPPGTTPLGVKKTRFAVATPWKGLRTWRLNKQCSIGIPQSRPSAIGFGWQTLATDVVLLQMHLPERRMIKACTGSPCSFLLPPPRQHRRPCTATPAAEIKRQERPLLTELPGCLLSIVTGSVHGSTTTDRRTTRRRQIWVKRPGTFLPARSRHTAQG
jgi:hypothetical protein